MNRPPLNNPDARYWDDLVEDFGFTQRTKSGSVGRGSHDRRGAGCTTRGVPEPPSF